jgi:hypothetical protein
LGGHLSWIELGGGRWHPKPVSSCDVRVIVKRSPDNETDIQLPKTHG